MNKMIVSLLAQILCSILVLQAPFAQAGSGNQDGSKSPPPAEQKKGTDSYTKRYVVVDENDIPAEEKAKVEPFALPVVGDFDEVRELTTPKSEERLVNVKLLADYLLKESASHPICRMNTHPKNCMLSWLITMAPRESALYPWLTYLKDTIWAWDHDIVTGMLQSSFGTHLVKKDLFTITRIILGEDSLFGSDSSETHAWKRMIFKSGLGPDALKVLTPCIDKYTHSFVEGLGETLPVDTLGESVGKFLMATIISMVFGFDITDEKYEHRFSEIREHFSKIVEAIVELPFDSGFQMRPSFMREPYLREHYGFIHKKRSQLLADVDWLIKTAQEEKVLENIGDEKPPARGGALLRAYVREAGGIENLKENHKQDLLNPMIAGTDTGALFQKIVISELARKKEAQDKIREEMLTALKRHNIPLENIDSHIWSDEQLTKEEMPALHQFLEEILIDFPPVPIDSRRVKDDFTVYFQDMKATQTNQDGRKVYKKIHLREGETMIIPIFYINPRERSSNPHLPPELLNLPPRERVKHMQTFVNSSRYHACVGQYFIRRLVKLLILRMMSSGKDITMDEKVDDYRLAFRGTIYLEDKLTIRFGKVDLREVASQLEDNSNPVEESPVTEGSPENLGAQFEQMSLSSSDTGMLRKRYVVTETPTGHQTPPAATLPLPAPQAQ